MRYAGVFALVVGLLILGLWIVSLATGQVPEARTEPVRLTFHVLAEITTAIALLRAGAELLARRAQARSLFLVASGMLIYSVIVSPGYFAQQGQWAPVALFGILLGLSLLSLRSVWSA